MMSWALRILEVICILRLEKKTLLPGCHLCVDLARSRTFLKRRACPFTRVVLPLLQALRLWITINGSQCSITRMTDLCLNSGRTVEQCAQNER